jgi:HrpA-like RNA helicase
MSSVGLAPRACHIANSHRVLVRWRCRTGRVRSLRRLTQHLSSRAASELATEGGGQLLSISAAHDRQLTCTVFPLVALPTFSLSPVCLPQDAPTNPFTNRPFSASYTKILEGRRKLPVYERMQEFYDIFNQNQIMVMVGETGSGKTTQCVFALSLCALPFASSLCW